MDAGATQKRHRHAQHDKDARASQSAATAPSTAKKLETLFENLSSFLLRFDANASSAALQCHSGLHVPREAAGSRLHCGGGKGRAWMLKTQQRCAVLLNGLVLSCLNGLVLQS